MRHRVESKLVLWIDTNSTMACNEMRRGSIFIQITMIQPTVHECIYV
jgi:hypothetical protein